MISDMFLVSDMFFLNERLYTLSLRTEEQMSRTANIIVPLCARTFACERYRHFHLP
jgi:hypothetical protein